MFALVSIKLIDFDSLQNSSGYLIHNAAFVFASEDPEIALLAPAPAPAILHDPVRPLAKYNRVINAETDQEHGVIERITVADLVEGIENAAEIELQKLGVESNAKWTVDH